ncbi:hypothetical protein DL93DRAFT_2155808 [Clavulina sp. PMI_390]|nr:hypothetical protein DL93DRAFT_2155808 [Clavulina sp. PMI_390]
MHHEDNGELQCIIGIGVSAIRPGTSPTANTSSDANMTSKLTNGPSLSELPEDILISILSHSLSPWDLVAVLSSGTPNVDESEWPPYTSFLSRIESSPPLPNETLNVPASEPFHYAEHFWRMLEVRHQIKRGNRIVVRRFLKLNLECSTSVWSNLTLLRDGNIILRWDQHQTEAHLIDLRTRLRYTIKTPSSFTIEALDGDVFRCKNREGVILGIAGTLKYVTSLASSGPQKTAKLRDSYSVKDKNIRLIFQPFSNDPQTSSIPPFEHVATIPASQWGESFHHFSFSARRFLIIEGRWIDLRPTSSIRVYDILHGKTYSLILSSQEHPHRELHFIQVCDESILLFARRAWDHQLHYMAVRLTDLNEDPKLSQTARPVEDIQSPSAYPSSDLPLCHNWIWEGQGLVASSFYHRAQRPIDLAYKNISIPSFSLNEPAGSSIIRYQKISSPQTPLPSELIQLQLAWPRLDQRRSTPITSSPELPPLHPTRVRPITHAKFTDHDWLLSSIDSAYPPSTHRNLVLSKLCPVGAQSNTSITHHTVFLRQDDSHEVVPFATRSDRSRSVMLNWDAYSGRLVILTRDTSDKLRPRETIDVYDLISTD